ncbi:siroheme synthase [Sphingorhabdus lutea]|uniref:precorrin-2 dehydrogenase n=2 Tax=Sphingorhabdus lutea TaxID=1913578 RepID=A0A1L3JAF6_9SPHN|nr:siroheme synthase [Sphingorhabdus lutea]
MDGRHVILLGEGEAADAKRRLIERAGGICVDEDDILAKIAFIAIEDEDEAIAAAARLSARGILVNMVDRPAYCEFTTPAIIDRNPVLIAIGTGGASAGMAKSLRQGLERLFPQKLGQLAQDIFAARDKIKQKWPAANDRRRALDGAFQNGGPLDPFADHDDDAVQNWLEAGAITPQRGLITIDILTGDPDDISLKTARLLGEADIIYYDENVSSAIYTRGRADAELKMGAPQNGEFEQNNDLILYLRDNRA